MIGRDSPVNNADWSTSNANEKKSSIQPFQQLKPKRPKQFVAFKRNKKRK